MLEMQNCARKIPDLGLPQEAWKPELAALVPAAPPHGKGWQGEEELTGFGAWLPWVKSQLCRSPAVWPWEMKLTFLNFGPLTCKVRATTVL